MGTELTWKEAQKETGSSAKEETGSSDTKHRQW
jgi:hypothetical protein